MPRKRCGSLPASRKQRTRSSMRVCTLEFTIATQTLFPEHKVYGLPNGSLGIIFVQSIAGASGTTKAWPPAEVGATPITAKAHRPRSCYAEEKCHHLSPRQSQIKNYRPQMDDSHYAAGRSPWCGSFCWKPSSQSANHC